MEQLLFLLNAAAYMAISAALMVCVVSPQVHDGVVMKTGLCCMSIAFGSLAYHLVDGINAAEVRAIERALLLLSAGLGVVVLSLAHRMPPAPKDAQESRT